LQNDGAHGVTRPTLPAFQHFAPCTEDEFWEDALMVTMMGEQLCQSALQNFQVMGVTDCLLLKLGNINCG
jgi:hypothetical protein